MVLVVCGKDVQVGFGFKLRDRGFMNTLWIIFFWKNKKRKGGANSWGGVGYSRNTKYGGSLEFKQFTLKNFCYDRTSFVVCTLTSHE